MKRMTNLEDRLIYIEKKIAMGFFIDEIIDGFSTATRGVPFD